MRSALVSRWRKLSLSGVISSAIIILALAAAIWVLVQGGSQLWTQSVRLNLPLLLLSLCVMYPSFLLLVVVWRQILSRSTVCLPFRHHLRIYCYSALSVTLPGGIWPIVGRSVLYQRLGANGLRVIAATVVESLVIGLGATCVYVVSVLVRPETSFWQRPEMGFVVGLGALLLLHPSIFGRLINWLLVHLGRIQEPVIVDYHIGELVTWIALEAIVVLVGALSLFILLNGLTAVPLPVLFRLIAGWAAISAAGNLLFWLPGTALLRDGGLVVLLMGSIPIPLAVLFALLVRVWSIASLLILAGLVWLFLDRPSRVNSTQDSVKPT